ncbi:exonuclease domain-containing protein [Novilysobacter avium]|uniref:Exonuclease domain-containing protein n=1 Tax=Novilysobacter avium TaxID=2781023 RepID=A0A7S6UKL7_9GAMM|nr:exonuclease domain-containing protein [Lysobacter avium]QOW22032.1 hypothetical protein INQ42_12665 [Lysobacter avium]
MRFLVVDCETTGLEDVDEPITIGAILCDFSASRDGEVIETYYSEQQPSRPISIQAMATHGIYDEDLAGKAFDLARFNQLVESADVIIAHNARFDARMLFKVSPQIIGKNWRCTFNQITYPSELNRESLDYLCLQCKVERRNPHNALNDCESLLGVLNTRLGKTKRSNTHLGRVLAEPEWRVFSRRNPMLRLESTDGIVFSEINEPRILECAETSPIQLWTKDHLDFVVGYFRYGHYHGRQGELFRFRKVDNPHIACATDEALDYMVKKFTDASVIIGPSG